MRLLAALGLAGACLATSPLFAADLLGSSPPPMEAAPLGQTELGSNWYIRGDIGYGQTNQATVVPADGLFPTVGNQPIGDAASPVAAVRGNNQTASSTEFGVGVGYRVNDWFRAEADWSFSRGPGATIGQTVFCPEVANAVSNYNYTTSPTGTAIPFGYQYDYTTCDGKVSVSQYNNTGLAMGYVDLGHWWLFSPYIGAGAGVNVNTLTGSLTFNQTDTGATYSGATVNGSAPAIWAVDSGQKDIGGRPIYVPLQGATPSSGTPQAVGPANWQRTINSNKYTFAGALTAGLGIQISQSATLDLGYHIMSLDVSQGMKQMRQSISLGVRYNIN